MGIDTEVAGVFLRCQGRVVRHLEKHQGIPMEYWYAVDGAEFDVREFTEEMRGRASQAAILEGDRDAHKEAIRHAIKGGFDLRARVVRRA